MALVLKDRVQQTGTANTTVSFTLSGSVTGFQSFSAIGNTNTTYYAATDTAGNWEVGIGTYSTTGPTLTRTTILSSSNSGSAVTFSGTVSVFATYPAGKSVNYEAAGGVIITGTQTVQAAATQDAVALAGRAGGTSSYAVTISPTTLTASRGQTLPDADGTVLLDSSLKTLNGFSLIGSGDLEAPSFSNAVIYTTSTTFVAPYTGVYRVRVVGGGGSGGSTGSTGATNRKATGGGAGGLAIKLLQLTAGNSYTVTVGAGGTAATSTTTATNGNPGGTSSFSGTGISTITANGGGGGPASNGSASLAGASGGTASGGDINITGGGSGTASGTNPAATGGGAVGWRGVGYSSGDASATGFTAGSGGAGIGGASGIATATSVSTASGGGGSGAASAAATNGFGAGGAAVTSFLLTVSSPLDANAAGSAGSTSSSSSAVAAYGGGSGAGGFASSSNSGNVAGLAGSGGALTGTGATSGTVSLGGGSGGLARAAAVTNTAGGVGFVLIEW